LKLDQKGVDNEGQVD